MSHTNHLAPTTDHTAFNTLMRTDDSILVAATTSSVASVAEAATLLLRARSAEKAGHVDLARSKYAHALAALEA